MKTIAADGQGPQHPCAGCGKGAHSSGFGCTELLVDAYPQLDLTHLPTHVPSKKDARYQVICLLCIGKYYKKQQEEQAITRMAAPATAATMLEDDVDDDNESDNEEGGGGKDSSSSATVGSG